MSNGDVMYCERDGIRFKTRISEYTFPPDTYEISPFIFSLCGGSGLDSLPSHPFRLAHFCLWANSPHTDRYLHPRHVTLFFLVPLVRPSKKAELTNHARNVSRDFYYKLFTICKNCCPRSYS